MQSKFEIPPEASSSLPPKGQTADESLAVTNALPAEVAHVLLTNGDSHVAARPRVDDRSASTASLRGYVSPRPGDPREAPRARVRVGGEHARREFRLGQATRPRGREGSEQPIPVRRHAAHARARRAARVRQPGARRRVPPRAARRRRRWPRRRLPGLSAERRRRGPYVWPSLTGQMSGQVLREPRDVRAQACADRQPAFVRRSHLERTRCVGVGSCSRHHSASPRLFLNLVSKVRWILGRLWATRLVTMRVQIPQELQILAGRPNPGLCRPTCTNVGSSRTLPR